MSSSYLAHGKHPSDCTLPPKVYGHPAIVVLRTKRNFQWLLGKVDAVLPIKIIGWSIHHLQSVNRKAERCFRLL